MQVVDGKAVIANIILKKYKPKEFHEGRDPDGAPKIFFYEFENDYMAAVLLEACLTNEEEKNIYLYECSWGLGFNFYEDGGLTNSKVYIHHPKEMEIAQEIRRLSNEFDQIKLPAEITQQIRRGEDFDPYEPLENWAKKFIKKFSSPSLPYK